jgi:LysW-gamma-L-lysine carboxypeptidase
LYGRGAVDAKGPLCAFIIAVAHAKAAIEASNWQVIVIGATEEEAPYSKGANHAAARYQPDMCIIGEPSGSDGITIGYKGRLLVEAEFDRGSQHTAAPGPSVSEVAMRLWEFVRDFARDYNEGKEKVFDHILASLRRVNSDDTGLVESCKAVIGLRLPVEFGPKEIESVIRKWMSDAKRDAGELGALFSTNMNCHMRFIGHESAHRSDRATPLAYAFVDAIRAEGSRPRFKLKTGTADFNVVAPIWKCPIIAYGPGDSSLDHTPHEHVPVAEFEKGVRVLVRAISALVAS